MINWKVRIKNKLFWMLFIPTVLLLASQLLGLFGITWDYTPLAAKLKDIVTTVFVILAALGIVVDPTTKGVGDSTQALTYDKPREDSNADN